MNTLSGVAASHESEVGLGVQLLSLADCTSVMVSTLSLLIWASLQRDQLRSSGCGMCKNIIGINMFTMYTSTPCSAMHSNWTFTVCTKPWDLSQQMDSHHLSQGLKYQIWEQKEPFCPAGLLWWSFWTLCFSHWLINKACLVYSQAEYS